MAQKTVGLAHANRAECVATIGYAFANRAECVATVGYAHANRAKSVATVGFAFANDSKSKEKVHGKTGRLPSIRKQEGLVGGLYKSLVCFYFERSRSYDGVMTKNVVEQFFRKPALPVLTF